MVTISRAVLCESQKIQKLEEKVWREKRVTSPYDAAFYVRFGYVFVAKDHGQLVGAIVAIKTREDDIAVIDWVVDARYRQKGVGRRLYERLEKESKPHHIVAYVQVDNTSSVEAHTRMGFKKFKKIQDLFSLGTQEWWWVMKMEANIIFYARDV